MFQLELTGEEYMELFEVLNFTVECLEGDDERVKTLENVLNKMGEDNPHEDVFGG